MASMVPYRSVFGIRPTSLFDALDDMIRPVFLHPRLPDGCRG